MARLGPGALRCLSCPRAVAQPCLSRALLPHTSPCWELLQGWDGGLSESMQKQRWEFVRIDAKVVVGIYWNRYKSGDGNL